MMKDTKIFETVSYDDLWYVENLRGFQLNYRSGDQKGRLIPIDHIIILMQDIIMPIAIPLSFLDASITFGNNSLISLPSVIEIIKKGKCSKKDFCKLMYEHYKSYKGGFKSGVTFETIESLIDEMEYWVYKAGKNIKDLCITELSEKHRIGRTIITCIVLCYYFFTDKKKKLFTNNMLTRGVFVMPDVLLLVINKVKVANDRIIFLSNSFNNILDNNVA